LKGSEERRNAAKGEGEESEELGSGGAEQRFQSDNRSNVIKMK